MSLSKLINIANWVIEKYENVKTFIKDKYRAYKSRRIRKSVDDGDIEYVSSLLRSIKKRRKDRRDAS